MNDRLHIFVVDDDEGILKALMRLIRSHGLSVEAFDSPAKFLAYARFDRPACVILDLLMPGADGLGVQQALSARGIEVPIIFLSGHGDVPTAARVMRDGAVDFLVKPIDEADLMAAIERAAAKAYELDRRQRSARHTEALLARLTPRERQVCDLVVQGWLNKQIAHELGTVEKTIKVHRSRVMHKLEVTSVAALVRLLSEHAVPKQTAGGDNASVTAPDALPLRSPPAARVRRAASS